MLSKPLAQATLYYEVVSDPTARAATGTTSSSAGAAPQTEQGSAPSVPAKLGSWLADTRVWTLIALMLRGASGSALWLGLALLRLWRTIAGQPDPFPADLLGSSSDTSATTPNQTPSGPANANPDTPNPAASAPVEPAAGSPSPPNVSGSSTSTPLNPIVGARVLDGLWLGHDPPVRRPPQGRRDSRGAQLQFARSAFAHFPGSDYPGFKVGRPGRSVDAIPPGARRVRFDADG